ncbi:fluoride efflux transporter FluC [Salirhabdus sp. Marseille-P4669]|uniref:fluoride efflux transporter FluC n=1 Tax=Salirhabdus sp. Marseille-P4669 TaxID=2042310 RepID=UPI000C7A6994|nr:CrcB family protein [Salirhabdus sp. Marseille-P4669]
MTTVTVAIGGFFGAILRFAMSKWNGKRNMPIGTLLANLLGSFLLGMLICFGIRGSLYAFLGIGFLGAFTTFSTFNKELLELLQHRRNTGLYYLILSYVGGITLAFIGFLLGEILI